MIAKVILLGLLMVMGSAGVIQADEKGPPFSRKNAFALKVGYHLYNNSDFTDYWVADKKDFNGVAAEVSYERGLLKYLALELALGYHQGNKEYAYRNLIFAGDNRSWSGWPK